MSAQSYVDWSRATLTIKAPVISTRTEDVQEMEVPLASLLTLVQQAQVTVINELCTTRGHLVLNKYDDLCARCGNNLG